MNFALKALNEGDSQTALQTIELLEATMDMAISEIPKEEFIDFSKINFNEFSANELIAAQSLMGDMMQKNIGDMTKMMDQIQSVEGAGFDIQSFIGSLDEKGFGFENIFEKNMENMGLMFGEDMSMIDIIEGMEMSVDLKKFIADHENIDLYSMMDHMKDMKDMSGMMMDHMSYENFSSMTAVINEDQIETMAEGMKQMMNDGHFDEFKENATIMGSMIKVPINDNEGEKSFVDKDGVTHFGDHTDMFESTSDQNMLKLMDEHTNQIGKSIESMSEIQMSNFIDEVHSYELDDIIIDVANISKEDFNDNENFETFVDKAGVTHFGDHSDMFEEDSLDNTFNEVFHHDESEDTFVDTDDAEYTEDHGDEHRD